MEDNQLIDPTIYSKLKVQMGSDFMVELIDAYVEETKKLIDELHQALGANDAAAFGRAAHSIKSSSASLGALVFSQQARELEMLGKANDLQKAGSKVEQLAISFLQVSQRLEELKNEP